MLVRNPEEEKKEKEKVVIKKSHLEYSTKTQETGFISR